jgi:serine protease Do
MGVDPDGIAAEKGLQQGDVILEAGGKTVSASTDVSAAVNAARKSGKRSVVSGVRTARTSSHCRSGRRAEAGCRQLGDARGP